MDCQKRARNAQAKLLANPLFPSPGSYSDIDYLSRLPTELLVLIAKSAHTDAIRQVEHPVPNVKAPSYLKPILALAAISRRLRSIIIGESPFWSYIRINANTVTEEAVITCLKRARKHPLTILWIGGHTCDYGWSGMGCGCDARILSIIMRRSHQWLSFAMVAPAGYLDEFFCEWRQSHLSAPILERIYVAKTSVPADPDPEEDDDYFIEGLFAVDIPSIQHLQICQWPFLAHRTHLKTLTRLEFEAPDDGALTFEELSAVATDLVQLEYLNIHRALDFDRDEELRWRPDLITWPSLLELVIRSETTEGGFIWRYLKLFKAPKLHKFVAISPRKEDFDTDETDASWIANNVPFVKEVTLLSPRVDGNTSQKLLAFFPKITHLSFCYSPCEHSFDSFFYPDGLSDTKIWPDLKSITLGQIQEEKLLRSIVDCLQRRHKDKRGIANIFIPGGQPHMARELEVVGANLRVGDIPDLSYYSLGPRQ
ncbi:hypothetical protein BDN72DRAFT_295975 [Pluteus cervinus]|uniref:Uncharacterized protein n=1 Tax=Pluteus cervinus TaxID=181527 RepID=A0ACD3B500_9AGAR|nr:hypothetical protein BDN72DRAFT_295975 [Pluteus cervinus]